MNLNSNKAKKELSSLIGDYRYYSEWKEVAYQNMVKDGNNDIAQDMFDLQYIYYSFMQHHTEMLLAELGIMLHGDLTIQYLKEYDWDAYNEEFNNKIDNMHRAQHLYNNQNKEVA